MCLPTIRYSDKNNRNNLRPSTITVFIVRDTMVSEPSRERRVAACAWRSTKIIRVTRVACEDARVAGNERNEPNNTKINYVNMKLWNMKLYKEKSALKLQIPFSFFHIHAVVERRLQ